MEVVRKIYQGICPILVVLRGFITSMKRTLQIVNSSFSGDVAEVSAREIVTRIGVVIASISGQYSISNNLQGDYTSEAIDRKTL